MANTVARPSRMIFSTDSDRHEQTMLAMHQVCNSGTLVPEHDSAHTDLIDSQPDRSSAGSKVSLVALIPLFSDYLMTFVILKDIG